MTFERNPHYPGSWLVYFNGIEIPAISVTVTANQDQPATCTVDLAPSRYIEGIGQDDRVRCTVFYLDVHYYEEPTFCLLFDGEITGMQTSRSMDQKTIQYTAVSLNMVLGQMFPFFVSNTDTLIGAVTNVFQSGQGQALAPVPKTTILFQRRLGSGEPVVRPFDIMLNVIEMCMGLNSLEENRGVVTTAFFTAWEERTNYRSRFAPTEYLAGITDPDSIFPLLKAAQGESVLDAAQQIGDRVASRGSYWMLITSLFRHLYYSIQEIPAPCAAPIDALTNEVVGPLGLTEAKSEVIPGLQQYITKPRVFFGLVPKNNVVWPSMTTDVMYQEEFNTQPTRTYIGNANLFRTTNPGSAPSRTVEYALTVGYPEEADASLQAAKSGDPGALDNFMVYPEEFFKGPVYNNLVTPSWFEYLSTQAKDQGPIQRTLRLYAQLEHERTRSSRRNGTASMAFNPYIVPGYNLAVVDGSSDGDHLFGDCVSVTHSLGQRGMKTSVQFTHVQRFTDFIKQLYKHRIERGDAEGSELRAKETSVMSAPAHPIVPLREDYQQFENARHIYSRAFYKAQDVDTVFDWPEFIGIKLDDVVQDIKVSSEVLPDEATGIPPAFPLKGVGEFLAGDHHSAMQYASRPVCTLEEFAAFQGERGTLDRFVPANAPREGKMHGYYVKILNLVQGPAPPPGVRADGTLCDRIDADTAQNWEGRLLKYRETVYRNLYPNQG